MKKYAFTLSEVLIVLIVLGVIATILLSSIAVYPKKEKIMFKKAYQIAERTVGELINDESIYPYDEDNFGFRNLQDATPEGRGDVWNGENKFCRFFAHKLNTFTDVPEIVDSNGDGINECHFQTTDGIDWRFNVSNFQAGNASLNADSRLVLNVDVNGVGTGRDANNINIEDRDRFQILVDFDGKVTVPASPAGAVSSEAIILREVNPALGGN